MKKSALFLFFSCFLMLNASAQRQTVFYIRDEVKFVSQVDSADFIRIFDEPENKSALFLVQEYYKNGVRKSMGYSKTIDPLRYEGQYASYFDNGQRKQFMNYVHGSIVDTVYSYYPNGKFYSAIFYQQIKDSTIMIIGTMKDSLGNASVTDGKGSAVIYDDDFKYVARKGNVINGECDGEWTGELKDDDPFSFKERYANGEMITGESTDGTGFIYKYTRSEIPPTYKEI